ncbi:hypothetical protein QQS21_009393 [Conoideocrella luteorostrata]|uniref:Uncharacterized protein n=1 Tax=Conoideocrella luteorostrata TaxID=1105319 RepID=A0AAJ0CGZ7_9HYPO|nr:hypothetical protein QQS21_009393 [Conoideocrella luteorostrata]
MPPNFINRHTTARSAMPPPMEQLAAAEPWRLHLVGSKRLAIPSFSTISRRGEDGPDNMINLMIILLGLVFFALLLSSLLFIFFRRRRLQRLRNGSLPTYEDAKQMQNPHGLTIETTHNGRSSIYYIGRDGQPMLQNPKSPPHSPDNVPQIHITFPDEHDDDGHTKSGRVLVVRVGDNAAVGLEPMQEEQLPAYEKEAKGQFQSIDMDRIGGLKEKDRTLFQQ